MKRFWAVAVCVTAIGGLGACKGADTPDQTPAPVTAETGAPASTDPVSANAPQVSADPAALPIAEGAPSFAVLYPGGSVEGEPVIATGSAGPGGLVTYLTDAAPEAVIAFHRQKAEAAGLASVMAMNQGEARAYGAARDGDNLQVVASPTPEGRTSVQLSWSAAG
ncbi:hypothetical protein [Brevundimonas aurifodinae]|uniref:Lipoprotein n=2 Tax=Brevundimonas TaxID=41275 RepID=A0ABV1NSA6_9CAUL|nr:MAG: hypothetical protein B7Z42_01250 [Brevundimonas sp. 12-68-7]OYX29983.1 MAG: hypothetical protein B7Z01_15075 [Brevundimonas subvibrioides]